jgi:hypothetical protein
MRNFSLTIWLLAASTVIASAADADLVPRLYVGGTATMIICRSNGQMLFLSHSNKPQSFSLHRLALKQF